MKEFGVLEDDHPDPQMFQPLNGPRSRKGCSQDKIGLKLDDLLDINLGHVADFFLGAGLGWPFTIGGYPDKLVLDSQQVEFFGDGGAEGDDAARRLVRRPHP